MARETVARVLLSAVMSLALSSCGAVEGDLDSPGGSPPDASAASAAEPSDPLVLYSAGEEAMQALVRGRLVREGDCLSIVADDGSRWLAAFPAQATRWQEEPAAVVFLDRPLEIGSEVELSGGEGGALEWVKPPAPACDTSSIWIVAPVRPSVRRSSLHDHDR
jgi:hypothetical protein